MNPCISFILVGVKMDGSSLHFFHTVSNTYGRGHREQHKISNSDDVSDDHIRWHKIGRSKVIYEENGVDRERLEEGKRILCSTAVCSWVTDVWLQPNT